MRAVVGLVGGALPGVVFLAAARGLLTSDGLLPVLGVATLAYFLSLPVAVWQFGRRLGPGAARGYVGGVIVATGVLLALLFTTGALF
jgi:hypothetical protein